MYAYLCTKYYGLTMHGIAWCIVWPSGPHMLYSMAWWASHGIMVWPGGPGLGYGMALQTSHGIWLWPGREDMGLGIVCSMTWRAWHGI